MAGCGQWVSVDFNPEKGRGIRLKIVVEINVMKESGEEKYYWYTNGINTRLLPACRLCFESCVSISQGPGLLNTFTNQ